MNMRVQKHIDTDNDGLLDNKTNYIYCHQKVCVEQDENGNLKKDYVHGGQYIDQVIMESDSSTSLGSYYLTDLRYSVYAVVDSDGAVTERYRYDAYGKRDVMPPGFVVVNTDAETEFGYTGRRHDTEDTGLMYFRARYYSAELGRFVGRDPYGTEMAGDCPRVGVNQGCVDDDWNFRAGIQYNDGMNLYCAYYVPLGVDPSGEEYIETPIKLTWTVTTGTCPCPENSGPGFYVFVEYWEQDALHVLNTETRETQVYPNAGTEEMVSSGNEECPFLV